MRHLVEEVRRMFDEGRLPAEGHTIGQRYRICSPRRTRSSSTDRASSAHGRSRRIDSREQAAEVAVTLINHRQVSASASRPIRVRWGSSWPRKEVLVAWQTRRKEESSIVCSARELPWDLLPMPGHCSGPSFTLGPGRPLNPSPGGKRLLMVLVTYDVETQTKAPRRWLR